ncbi:FUSC family protein [Nibrella saemangeumensis]|uniref:FUSC family protein n=1 Tax=Nibrella saemangeumensis TaxID=1084526 RepID=A0ABP8N1A9_9BACT
MRKQLRSIQYFFFSQYFSDGLRTTLAILLPALVVGQLHTFDTGLMLSLGALCVSITDIPGPWQHKRNGMLACALFAWVVALITGFARLNTYALGLEILLFSFFFSMFVVYGNRAAAVGSAALLALILMMDRPLQPAGVLVHSALILVGGLWYMGVSLLFFRIRPYRLAQQALGECVHEIARFLAVKARFYNTNSNLKEGYQQLVTQQVVVSEKQEVVREILFKSRQMVEEPTDIGRRLVLIFVDTVDLYEQISAMYYDYAALRKRFGHTGVLDMISALISHLVDELDELGLAIQSNQSAASNTDFDSRLEQLKARIDQVGETESNLVLKKILVNFRNLYRRINDIRQLLVSRAASQEGRWISPDYTRFVTSQRIEPAGFFTNLTLESSVFRHSLRTALACLTGFVVINLLAYGQHSYWVLLTITAILKPAFSLTRQRNYERIVGTLAGGVIGVLILVFVQSQTVKFVFLLIFMIGLYSFQRKNYIVMVVCVTPFVLILFNIMGLGLLGIAGERVLDTLIGCGIAFAAGYLIFPNWESEQVTRYMAAVLKANGHYLVQLAQTLAGKEVRLPEYKLARKEVYVSSANLSAAFQRMLSEPRSKQRHQSELLEFVVLNHIVSSNIATIASDLIHRQHYAYPAEVVKPVKQAMALVQRALLALEPTAELPGADSAEVLANEPVETLREEDRVLTEQVRYIEKISEDIRRVTETVAAGSP